MTIVIALSALTGIAIGFRFNILMVVLAVLSATVTIAVISAAQGEHSWPTVPALVFSAIALQVGYLCSSFAVSMREAPHEAVDVAARADTYRSRRSLSA
jgi:hypothetical protein